MYVITFFGFYVFGEVFYESSYTRKLFPSQESCLVYLIENRETVVHSALQEFGEFKANGKTYVLEGYNLECDVFTTDA
tara:strand:+ start:860 stop:1093 length:234 start_codon:yes stop_codon:yes gene_type:complete